MTAKAKNIMEETLEAGYSPAALATLAIAGAKRGVDGYKTCLNLAAEQNADILASLRQAMEKTPWGELPILDLTEQAIEGYVAIQNELLDLTLEQITAVTNACQAAGTDVEKARSEFANVLQTSADRATVAQNSVINYTAKQAKAGISAVKSQPGVAGKDLEAVADSIQRGFDTVLTAQKELVAMGSKQVKSAAAKL